jgi:hypothetical protein
MKNVRKPEQLFFHYLHSPSTVESLCQVTNKSVPLPLPIPLLSVILLRILAVFVHLHLLGLYSSLVILITTVVSGTLNNQNVTIKIT